MLKKEWRDIFLPALLRLSVGPLFAAFQLTISRGNDEGTAVSFYIGFALSIYWIANYLGLTSFRSEFRNRSFEYLLTFPGSRLRLLAYKLIPRLLTLGIIVAMVSFFFSLCLAQFSKFSPEALAQFRETFPFLTPSVLGQWALILFFISFFLSLVDWGAFRLVMPIIIFITFGLLSWLLSKLVRPFLPAVDCNLLSIALILAGSAALFTYIFGQLGRWTSGGLHLGLRNWSAPGKASPKQGRNWGILRIEWPLVVRSLMLTILLVLIYGFLSSLIFVNNGEQKALSDRVTFYAIIAGMMLLMVAFNSGNRLMYKEFRYKAMEYILTFPLGLRRILLEKLLARIVVLGPAMLIFMIYVGHFSERISHNSGMLYVLLRPAFFPFWMALLLLNGFFLSLFEMKNIMALVSLANLYALVLIPLALFRLLKHFAIALSPQTMTMLAIGSGLVLTTMILAGIFFRLLPRFDLAAPRRYSRVFGWFLFTTFTILSLAGLTVVLFV